MKTTFGPSRLSVVLDTSHFSEVLQLWRIVRTDVPEDPVFINSFRSNYELRHPPRKIEDSAAVIHMGISMYMSQAAALKTAERFEKLGDFVARVDLVPEKGFNYAVTGPKGHLTIWGDPVKLSEQAVEIYPVER